jgi:hypothetical protein
MLSPLPRAASRYVGIGEMTIQNLVRVRDKLVYSSWIARVNPSDTNTVTSMVISPVDPPCRAVYSKKLSSSHG